MPKSMAQIKAIEKKNRQRFLAVNPELNDEPGIYFLVREENGYRYGYVGKASVSVLGRLAQHLSGWQHIDLSLKSHGLYSEDNPTGWRVGFKNFPKEVLDEKEQFYIKKYANAGYQMRNKNAGGTDGSSKINDYRPAKGYRQGIQAGKKQLARSLKDIIDKHLVVNLKPEKQNNKISQKQEKRFWEMLDERSYE